jgi:hypothetical protein
VTTGSNAKYGIIEMHLLADVQIGTLLGEEGRETSKITSEYNIARGFHLVHRIEVIRCADHDKQSVNKSIFNVTKGKVGEYWKGPIVVTRRLYLEGAKDGKQPAEGTTEIRFGRGMQYEDMALADLRHAVDLFWLSLRKTRRLLRRMGVLSGPQIIVESDGLERRQPKVTMF